MGEYALYKGERIKIGTCEEMYYLRADQAHLVRPLPGNVDPVRHAAELRFRFPFPNEDRIEPGQFDDCEKSVRCGDATLPAEWNLKHSTVQFKANYPANGYLVNLLCPESGEDIGFTIHKNGYGGAVHLVQQRFVDGHMVAVVRCGGCGEKWRLPTLANAEYIIVGLRAEGDRARQRDRVAQLHNPGVEFADSGKFWHDIADRVTAGYTQPAPFLARATR